MDKSEVIDKKMDLNKKWILNLKNHERWKIGGFE